jgi:hypothetical protein
MERLEKVYLQATTTPLRNSSKYLPKNASDNGMFAKLGKECQRFVSLSF